MLDVGATGAWDADAIDMPAVLKVGSTYRLWYHGRSGPTGGIGCATSSNGMIWTKCAGNPVFGGGGSGSWDYAVYAPTVLYDGGVYRMWYSGCDASNAVCSTGYATSSDGSHWSPQTVAVPQGAAGAFDGYSADYPAVLRVGNTYQMWYSGIDASQTYRIGYATAPMLNLDKSVYLPAVLKPPGTPLPPPALKVPTYIPTSTGESHEP